jgi:superfamily I DNA/RNA helicase
VGVVARRRNRGATGAPYQRGEHLVGLNETQDAVARHDEGVAAMWAVPGSGKTRTVTSRICELVRKGRDPRKILAVTFTRAAADEMNKRIGEYGVKVAKRAGDRGARVGTYHSLCLEILRDGSPWAGHEVDAADKMCLALKQIVGWCGMRWDGVDITKVLAFIGGCKNDLVLPEDSAKWNGLDWNSYDARYPEAYFKYEDEREKRGLITFDDMLCLSVRFLQGDADALGRWQGRYEHVIVDEYQDTNLAQYELVRMLAAKSRSFLVVGDDDQLIYAWRGSRPELSTGFTEAFGAAEYRAELNYRTRPEVIERANAVVKFNDPHRVVKASVAVREAGGSARALRVADLDAEAETVVEEIRQAVEDGAAWKDHVVLYRTNAQSRAFEEVMLREQVPHVVEGGVDFYSRKEVADLLAYLRLAVDQADDESFKRAVNRPFRFVGKATIDNLEHRARRRGLSMLALLESDYAALDSLQDRQVTRLWEFVSAVRNVRDEMPRGDGAVQGLDNPAILTRLLRETGYEEWLRGDEGSDTAENSRLSNIRELVRTSGRFKDVTEFLEHVDEVAAMRKRKRRKQNAVRLMTVHRSKGREWPTVFVAGAAEDILPHARGEEREERRLFYVAVTRARDNVLVTCPSMVLVGGKATVLEPSRFVTEAGFELK